jgi:excisionase family DNA binding protein
MARTASPNTPWTARPVVPLATAAELVGLSRASLYALASAGRLQLLRLGGRTLVATTDVQRLLAQAEPFVPGAKPRGRAAKSKRAA